MTTRPGGQVMYCACLDKTYITVLFFLHNTLYLQHYIRGECVVCLHQSQGQSSRFIPLLTGRSSSESSECLAAPRRSRQNSTNSLSTWRFSLSNLCQKTTANVKAYSCIGIPATSFPVSTNNDPISADRNLGPVVGLKVTSVGQLSW